MGKIAAACKLTLLLCWLAWSLGPGPSVAGSVTTVRDASSLALALADSSISDVTISGDISLSSWHDTHTSVFIDRQVTLRGAAPRPEGTYPTLFLTSVWGRVSLAKGAVMQLRDLVLEDWSDAMGMTFMFLNASAGGGQLLLQVSAAWLFLNPTRVRMLHDSANTKAH